jgi:hypothetical protein
MIKHSGKLSLIFFVAGFVLDNITLTRIDSLTVSLILLFYIFTSLSFIFLSNYGDYKGVKNQFLFKIYTFAPFIIQFTFGALFSGYVIFFTRSASFFDS